MTTIESPVSQQMADADFRATLAADGSTKLAEVPEGALTARGPTLTDADRESVACLRPLLALPTDALLQRLLDGPDDDPPWRWDSYPSLATYLP